MKAFSCASALALLVLATPASGKGAAWCQVDGGKYQAYLSDIVEVDDGPQAFHALVSGAFGKGFEDYVRSSLDPAASGLNCTRQESRFYAEDYIDVLIKANPGFKFVKTGWHATRASAGTATPAPRSGGVSRTASEPLNRALGVRR